jgi:nucleoid-associated protein YgaU
MGMFSFVKEAVEKLFARDQLQGSPQSTAQADKTAGTPQAKQSPAQAIASYIASQNLQYKDLTVTYDGANQSVTVKGVAPDQQTKEKILLCCGNVQGVASVVDEITVEKDEPESKYHTVVSGDTLSKIAKAQYGDANKYMKIFEANKPMLKDPDKIYPGQVLRIPAA